MFIVGLTGGIATVVEPGKRAWHKIKKEFGEDVFTKDGHLNREALGELIFQDVEKRRKLNEITHPEISREMFWAAVRCIFQGHQFIVMDLPLLFESGSMLDEEDLQLQRLMDRNSMSESRAKQRISAQMPLDSKCEKGHFVVENSGTVDDTRQQVLKIISVLQSYNTHWKMRAIVGLCCTGFSLALDLARDQALSMATVVHHAEVVCAALMAK
ncbi:unnamed protein product [Timema podura]|uniref:Dephospho-CoA kinase n=1 Tax=Timema podura TaxID=61482 RepID=A0ABN7NBM7_TIMPD|nr:unnamed protein product [Timema podura]